MHLLRIAEHLSATKTQTAGWLQQVTTHYTRAWGDATAVQAAALHKLWALAYREAEVQAFADAYLAIAICFVLSRGDGTAHAQRHHARAVLALIPTLCGAQGWKRAATSLK